MGINDLPKPGGSFKTTLGPGSFQRKLSSATRSGGLANLRDNQDAITKAVKKYEGVIRTKGGLSRMQKLAVWSKIKASDKTVNKQDKVAIKEILKHLGRDSAARKQFISATRTVVPNKKTSLSEEQKKRNIRMNMAIDDSALLEDSDYRKTDIFALGSVSQDAGGFAQSLVSSGKAEKINRKINTGFAKSSDFGKNSGPSVSISDSGNNKVGGFANSQ